MRGGRETTGSRGALEEIVQQPFGQVLLAIIALGLLGYGGWKLIQAFRDPEHVGRDAKGVAKRIGYGACERSAAGTRSSICHDRHTRSRKSKHS